MLVPIGSGACKSNTPTPKFVVVSVVPVTAPIGQRTKTPGRVAVPAWATGGALPTPEAAAQEGPKRQLPRRRLLLYSYKLNRGFGPND